MSENLRPDRTYAVAAFAAIAVFVGTWTLLHVGFYRHKQIADTPVYQRYGNQIAHGKVPYRDFDLEYPPGALPMFALPGLAAPGHGQDVKPGFRRTFETLMWMCGAVALLAMALTLRALRADPWVPLLFAAVAPLALGSVILSRFDLWPAVLVAGATAALVSARFRTGHVLLGIGAAAKFYPGVLGIASTVVQAAVLVWIWVSFARGPATSSALVRASAAAVCAFIAFGKVLSPQFLIWLIPVVPLVRGRRGLWAGALLLAALVLTQVWFPFRYFRLALDFEAGLSWVLLARDLVLVALALLLASSLRRDAIRPEYP